MTNYEFHKEVIEKHLLEYGTINLGVEGNKVKECVFIHCANCEFHNKGCNKARAEWLNAEYEEPITSETLSRNFRKFCNKNHDCEDCEFNTSSISCRLDWILKNYNITKKEGDNNDD